MNEIENAFNKLNLDDKFYSTFKLSDFNIEREVGKGAYAKVYKALHVSSNKYFALKSIDLRLILKEKKLYQVYVEIGILKELNHSFICKSYGLIKDESKLIVVLDYYPNGDLFDFVKENSKIN